MAKPESNAGGLPPEDNPEGKPEVVTVIVARGHTIQTPDGEFGEGQEVKLEYSEAERLYRMGRVLEPDEAADMEPVAVGVRMSSAEGVNVRVAA